MPELSDADILNQARKEFAIADKAESEIREEYNRCMRFVALDQYPPTGPASADQRTAAGLPSLVVDNLGPICDQIINDWIRNRMGIIIGPGDAVATEATAKILSGYVRNVEYLSRGRLHYDQAFKNMVRGNRGVIGVLTRRKPGTFKQELYIRGFKDSNAVYFDPFAKEIDLTDMDFAFVRDIRGQTEFKHLHPGDEIETDFADWGEDFSDWVRDDGVIVAEYWKVIVKMRKIQQLTKAIRITRGNRIISTDVVYKDEYKKLPRGVEVATDPADGGKPMEDEEPQRKVMQYEITGRNILSRTEWLGSVIPLVPMIGREIIVEGKKKIFSAISRALDPQCQLNYAESGIAEELGTTVRAPYIGALGQFKTMSAAWKVANLQRFPFLEYDMVGVGDKLAPPPTRQAHEPQIQALALASDRAQNNIRMTTGMNKSTLGIEDYKARSGRAINALKSEGDNSTFDLPAAGSSALEVIGCIIVDVAPKIIGAAELIQILNDEEKQETVLVNAPVDHPSMPKGQDVAHLLDQGEYKVRVSAAPSHQTMREETQAILTDLFQELPEPQKVMIAAPLVREMNFNGKDGIAERLELPQYKKPADGSPAIPPEAQAVIQQGQQLVQAAQQHIQVLERERDAKVLDLENKKDIAAMNNETQLAIARIAQETKTGITAFETEIETIRHMLDTITAHMQMGQDAASQAAAQQHEATMQQNAQQHQQGLQESAQQASADQATQAQQAQAATAGGTQE